MQSNQGHTSYLCKRKIWDIACIVPVSGAAANFLGFIQKELCRFIENEYRTDPAERCLAGGSLGGLFCLYVLFRAPDLFSKYIIGNPALFWDNRIAFGSEEAFSKNQKSLPVQIYSYMGALEGDSMIPNWQEMIEILQSRNYDRLEITPHLIDGENHFSVSPIAFSNSMRVLFPPE